MSKFSESSNLPLWEKKMNWLKMTIMGHLNIYLQTFTLLPKQVYVHIFISLTNTAFLHCIKNILVYFLTHLSVFSSYLLGVRDMEVAPQIYEVFPVFCCCYTVCPVPPPSSKAEVNKHALHLYVCTIAPCWNTTGAANTYLPQQLLLIKPF